MFVRSPSGRKRLNVLGALNFATKQLTTITNTTYVTSTTVCELLQLLVAQNPGAPITLVLDNARYQHCQLVQNLAAELSVELLFLPSYSPNLNLIERLWKYVKKDCLNSKYYETFAHFQSAITDCLARINSDGKRDMKSLISRNFQLFDNQTFLAS